MEITNLDLRSKGKSQHHWLLPDSIRCIICGPSACGKTNLMLNFLLKSGYLNYDRLYIYSKTLGQEKYQLLRHWTEAVEQCAKKEVASFHSSADNIIPADKLNSEERSIMVFDDVMIEKQGPIEKYFCLSRHGGADCLYLTQNYFRIPKQAIRDNANLIILFNQDNKNQRAIHDTFVGGDMPFEEFQEFFSECTREPYGFAVIDLTCKVYDGKYRCGFYRFYIPKTLI